MNKNQIRFLLDLLSQPTAPFRESHVVRFIESTLTRARVPYFLDPIGNVVIGVSSKARYHRLIRQRAREPVRVFIAHMDHPGFIGSALEGRRLLANWHGGSATQKIKGAKVWLANNEKLLGTGTVTAATLAAHGHGIKTLSIALPAALRDKPAASKIFGGFSFKDPVWRAGKLLYTKAADDLIGVFAILQTAIKLFKQDVHRSTPFLGLLTRAEEVGFVGAVGHFELNWLNQAHRPLLCVSLESSRTLPDALIGKGPVVRLGDRRTVFNPDALKVLGDVAEKILPERHQKRIMDGGSCEATAATAYGFPAIGLSVPLGNYHNQGLELGPQSRGKNAPSPEFVHMNDVEGMLKLCDGLMQPRLPWHDGWKIQRRRFKKNLTSYRKWL